jgi:hypothetical protein
MSIVNRMAPTTAADIIWMFERTYRLTNGRFLNKRGEESSQRTLDLVSEAQAILADQP